MAKIHRNIESDYFKLYTLKDLSNREIKIFDSNEIKNNNNLQCSVLLDYSFNISHKYIEPFSNLRGLINPLMGYMLQNGLNFSLSENANLNSNNNDNIITTGIKKSLEFANSVSRKVTATITGKEIKNNTTVANPYTWYFPYMWSGTNYPQFSVNIKLEALSSYTDLKEVIDNFNRNLKIKNKGAIFQNYKVFFGNIHSSWVKAGGNSDYSGIVSRLLKYNIKGNKSNIVDNYPMSVDITLNFEINMPYYNV